MTITRRDIVKGGLAAGATLMAAETQTASAQTPKRLIVDAQVHLWKAESPDWPWVPGLPPHLPEPFAIEKLVPLMDEAGVDHAVIVPPSWPGDRNDYGLEAAKRYPGRFAVMGRISLKNPQSAALLPKWKEQPGMLGVRVTFLGENAPWINDGTADWFWPAAEKAGIPVMFFAPGRVSLIGPIAEKHPGLPLIIDHMGLTAALAKDGKLDAAIDQAVSVAKYPNVGIKMSASPGVSQETYPFRDMTRHLKRVFDAYGPQRCYWGTDLTNTWAKGPYRQRVTHFTEELGFLSESDKDWVMGKAILARLGWA